MTPLQKLASLLNADSFLKAGVTLWPNSRAQETQTFIGIDSQTPATHPYAPVT
jgi:hypothetical protein